MNTKFIRVGSIKIHVRRNEGRWTEELPGWNVSGSYGWIVREKWKNVVDYQTPVEMDEESRGWYLANGDNYKNFSENDTACSREIGRKLRLAGYKTIWEMDLTHKNDYIRMFAILGESVLRTWSWWDVWVILPFYKLIAKVLTFVNY